MLVEGRLKTQSWEDKASGVKKYRTEIVAENVRFGSNKDRADNTSQPAPRDDGSQPAQNNSSEEEISIENIPF